VNQTFKIALAVGLFSLVVGALFGHWLTNNYWKAKWADRDTADAKALIAANATERAKELSWQVKVEKVSEDAKKRNETIAADAAELSDVVARLRKQIAGRHSDIQGANSAATNISRAAATDKVMHSVMLETLIIRAEQYAGFADESRAAGLTCQAAYDAIRRNEGEAR
jgi:uncharacterized membrane protein YcjF (UPF0283 family)